MKKRSHPLMHTILLLACLMSFLFNSCKKDAIDNGENNTNEGFPVLTTTAVTDITDATAKSGGSVTSDGGASVTERGVCWSTGQTPTISDNKTSDGAKAESYVCNLTGLTANTTYYVRAYATNSNGTGYGSAMSFTTQSGSGNTFTDSRDGSVYHTVTIGTQTWMGENLRYLPSVVGQATESNTTPYYYVYGYNGTDVSAAKATANYNTYGALYNWPAACSACPTGWHLPTDAEWMQLNTFLGGTYVAGGKLKETGTAHWKNPNVGATNESGFTALPGGYRGQDGTFYDILGVGYWWTATAFSTNNAYYWHIGYSTAGLGRDFNPAEVGFSVRCVKD